MAIVNELVTSLEFKLGPRALETIESVKRHLTEMTKGISSMANGSADALDKLQTKVKDVADSMLQLNQKSLTTGISQEAIQRWGHAAKVAGLSAEAIFRDLETLKLTEGIKNEAVIDVLNRLTAVGNNEGAAFRILEDFKLSKDFYTLLKTFGGTEGLLAKLEEARFVPDKDVENSAKLAQNLNEINSHLETMKDRFFAGLSEPLNAQLERTQEFLKRHGYFEKEIDMASETVGTGIAQAFDIANSIADQIMGDKPIDIEAIRKAYGENANANIVTTATLLGLSASISKIIVKLAPLEKIAIMAKIINDFYDLVKRHFEVGPETLVEQADREMAEMMQGRMSKWNWINPAFLFRQIYSGTAKAGEAALTPWIGDEPNIQRTRIRNEELAARMRILQTRRNRNQVTNITNNNTQNVTVNPSTFSGGYGTMQALGLATAAGYNGNTILGTE